MKDAESLFKAELRAIEKRLQRVIPVAVKLASKSETYGAVKQVLTFKYCTYNVRLLYK